MSRDYAPIAPRTSPLDWLAGILGYVGGLGLLALAATRAIARPRGYAPPLVPAVSRQLEDLLKMAVPLVFLVHVPLGSFLAMQAFFSATFREAVGAVVGLGLLRNLAPMATGLTLAGLLSARIVPELRNRPAAGLDDDPTLVPDRDVALGRRADPRGPDDPARLATTRILAAALAGPALALLGWLTGSLIGVLVAQSVLGVSPAIFVGKMQELLRPVDGLGLMLKSMMFAGAAALLACHEGLRTGADARSTPAAACRSACLAILAILVTNGSWFKLAYSMSSPFGPEIVP